MITPSQFFPVTCPFSSSTVNGLYASVAPLYIQKMSKSQRKKQARAAQEAEREERIRAEKEAMGGYRSRAAAYSYHLPLHNAVTEQLPSCPMPGPTERAMEESALLGLLSPLNLSIREVRWIMQPC